MRSPEDAPGGLLERPTEKDAPEFVLAAGGLRRLHGRGGGFLGYPAPEMFWRDLLDLAHEEDLPRAKELISAAIGSPGISLRTELRFRDAGGGWRPMNLSLQNAREAPGDVGLVIADVHDAGFDSTSRPEADGEPPFGS